MKYINHLPSASSLPCLATLLLLLAAFQQPARLHAQATLPPDMVFIQGGTFTMGCTAEQQPDCAGGELPAHEVTLTDFYMGKYEVTQGQWTSLFSSNPSYFNACGANCPVEYISWYAAAVFCNRLSEQTGYTPCYYADAGYTQVYGKNGSNWSLPNTGTVYLKPNAKGYRLPTEAEWEYAARGGSGSKGYKYSGSNTVSDVAWYNANSSNMTRAVGTKIANELGLNDLSGNVLEWCYDSDSNYANSPACAPTGPSGSVRVIRGGCWFLDAGHSRVSDRGSASIAANFNILGFRLCRTP